MTVGDLESMDALLFTALQTLVCPSTGSTATRPFAVVDRYTGEVNDEWLREMLAQNPGCFLRYDLETGRRWVNTVGGGAEDYGTVSWTCLVTLADPRTPGELVMGADASGVKPYLPGLFDLFTIIYTTLDVLTVSGAWNWRRLRYAETKPVLQRRGVGSVWGVRMEAYRYVEYVAPTDTSVALTDIYGNVSEYGNEDEYGYGTANPFDVFKAP